MALFFLIVSNMVCSYLHCAKFVYFDVWPTTLSCSECLQVISIVRSPYANDDIRKSEHEQDKKEKEGNSADRKLYPEGNEGRIWQNKVAMFLISNLLIIRTCGWVIMCDVCYEQQILLLLHSEKLEFFFRVLASFPFHSQTYAHKYAHLSACT